MRGPMKLYLKSPSIDIVLAYEEKVDQHLQMVVKSSATSDPCVSSRLKSEHFGHYVTSLLRSI